MFEPPAMYGVLTPRGRTASNRTPREINRSLVLHLLRKQQPISRADLARVSGLQRSTISLIVEELIAEKLVLEGSTGRLPRGRRPTYLQINPQRAILALDIHPDQVTLAVSDLSGRILEQKLVDIPTGSRSVSAMVAAVKRTLAEHKENVFDGIGICLPGRTDPSTDKPIFAPNLHFPIGDLRRRFAEATGLRADIDNVANACVLAEVWFSGAETRHDLVVVNVSEGIGTGILANGQLVRGEHGMAGEFGHIQLDPDGPPCGCGSHGCWETLASNRAALRDFAASLANGNGTHPAAGIPNAANSRHAPSTSPTGNPVASFPALLNLAQAGDPNANAALQRMALHLGKGLRLIVAALAPREIVIVGDLTSAWHRLGPQIDHAMRENTLRSHTTLRPAFDGNLARLRGAVALVLSAKAAA